jgi:hypothetical protein
VPLAALGVVLIGGSYWYPDGYVSVAQPLCGGLTPDGCQLNWRVVDFEDGGGVPQCVQYCPQVGPPPARVAELPPPPPPANGSCEMTIFADPNFGGLSAPTAENQGTLSQAGWLNEISSVQVQSGTWEFYADEKLRRRLDAPDARPLSEPRAGMDQADRLLPVRRTERVRVFYFYIEPRLSG